MTHRPRLLAALAASAALLGGCTSQGARPAVARTTPRPSGTPPAAASGTPTATAGSAVTASTPAAGATPAGSSAPAPKGVVVVAAGDIACAPDDGSFAGGNGTDYACRQQATSELVRSIKPAAVLALGDLQYEVGRLAAFQSAYGKSWGRFKAITWPAPGNHEYGTGVTRGYFEYFGPRAGRKSRSYYSTDIGGWHVVSLNSNCAQIGGCERGSAEEKWLRADLAKSRAKCTIAFMHHPRWSSGLHGPSTKVDGLWRALAEGGADIMLVGHDHHYERFSPLDADGKVDPARGVREFIVGTGGRSLYPAFGNAPGSEIREAGTFGVLKLTLQPSAYRWEFVPVSGANFTDSGSGSCH